MLQVLGIDQAFSLLVQHSNLLRLSDKPPNLYWETLKWS